MNCPPLTGKLKTYAKMLGAIIILTSVVPIIMMKVKVDRQEKQLFMNPLQTKQIQVINDIKPI